LTIAAICLSRIHATLEITELAVGSAPVVVQTPVALHGRWRNSARYPRRVVRICRRAGIDGAEQDGGGDHQETE